MPVLIQCSSCQRKMRVRTDLAGKTVRCPNCRAKFVATVIEEQAAPAGQEEVTPAEAAAEETAESMVAPPRLEETPEASSGPTVRRPVAPPAPEPLAPVPQEAIAVRPPREIPEPAPAPKEEPRPPAPARAAAADPVPFETPANRVYLVLGLILLFVMLIGLAGGWWISASITASLGKRGAVVPARPPGVQFASPNSARALCVVCSASASGVIPLSRARQAAV